MEMGLEWKSEEMFLLIPLLFTDPADTQEGLYIFWSQLQRQNGLAYESWEPKEVKTTICCTDELCCLT